MPDYRIKTRLVDDVDAFAEQLKSLWHHAAPYAALLSNPRFVGGYLTFTCDKTLGAAMRDHLNIEAAP